MVDLFTGVDGLGYALQSAGLVQSDAVRAILFEVDDDCRQILQQKRVNQYVKLSDWKSKQGGPAGSAEAMSDRAYVRRLLQPFPGVKRVLIAGGSPCQGFSQANPVRTGGVHAESSKIWMFVVALSTVRSVLEELGMSCQVCFLLENVAMEERWSSAISKILGVP